MRLPIARHIVLTATNGTRIRTNGPETLRLDLGFKQMYFWTFEKVDVARPIIGADFVQYFGLLINVKCNRLINQEDLSIVQTILVHAISTPVFIVSR